jgi:hypothetical protein
MHKCIIAGLLAVSLALFSGCASNTRTQRFKGEQRLKKLKFIGVMKPVCLVKIIEVEGIRR